MTWLFKEKQLVSKCIPCIVPGDGEMMESTSLLCDGVKEPLLHPERKSKGE